MPNLDDTCYIFARFFSFSISPPFPIIRWTSFNLRKSLSSNSLQVTFSELSQLKNPIHRQSGRRLLMLESSDPTNFSALLHRDTHVTITTRGYGFSDASQPYKAYTYEDYASPALTESLKIL